VNLNPSGCFSSYTDQSGFRVSVGLISGLLNGSARTKGSRSREVEARKFCGHGFEKEDAVSFRWWIGLDVGVDL